MKKYHGNMKESFCSKDELTHDYNFHKLSYVGLSKKYEVSVRRVKKWILIYGIKPRPKHVMVDLTGKRFGRLIVKEFIPRNLRPKGRLHSASSWLCICDCGSEKIIRATSLTGGLTTSCGCLKKENHYKGLKDLSGCFISRIKNGATSRGLKFNLTNKYLWDLFVLQDRRCALSGIPINLERNLTKNYNTQTASLDRINNKLSYVKGNVWWVHKDVNMMKWKLKLEDFLFFCEKIASNMTPSGGIKKHDEFVNAKTIYDKFDEILTILKSKG